VVVFDTLFRLLRHVYGSDHVTYVRNVTDVDDKIIRAAGESGEPIDQLTQRMLRAFHEDMAALGALSPTAEPTATGHIADMIAMIEQLLGSGHAYMAQGHVLFEVAKNPNFGALSGRDRASLEAGARVEVAPYKKDPADFVLWKPASTEEPGWDSPWGRGRPGWHIECSAMARRYLGAAFDIHAGGQDLIFPHHENEIAQSTCCGDRFAQVWLHNGHVLVDGAKMAKSAGNFTTVRDLLEQGHAGQTIRLALLSSHYRQPLDLSADKLAEAKATLDRIYRALDAAPEIADTAPTDGFMAALADDLNTPSALADLHERVRRVFLRTGTHRARAAGQLRAGARLLGLPVDDPASWFRADSGSATAEEIERLIAARSSARASRDFVTADRIRDDLRGRGVALEDGPERTRWQYIN
jgi:cysteinyl-tRNA synthetase